MPPKLQAGGTLDPRKHVYIVRQDVEDEIFRLLARGEYCNLMASRQVGKSSLMKKTALRLREQGIRIVDMDIAGELGGPKDAATWYVGFLGKVARDLRLPINVKDWWEQQQGTPNQRLLQFFREEVVLECESPAFAAKAELSHSALIVIFVDEIDSTLKLPYTDDFFTAIRTMYNDRASAPVYEKIAFCLIGVTTPNELIKDRRTTPYNIGQTFELRDFEMDKDDLTPLIHTIADDPEQGKTIVNALLKWTDGQPYLTILLCDDIRKQQITLPEEVDRFINEKFNNLEMVKADAHFERIASFLNTRIPDQFAALELYKHILHGKKKRDETTFTHIYLKLAGLVKRSHAGDLIVRNRIYEQIFNPDWVRLKNRPQKILHYVRRFATSTMILLIIIAVWWAIVDFIIEPHRAEQLKDELSRTFDENRVKQLYGYLSSQQEDPILKKYLIKRHITGYEDDAQKAHDAYWDRIKIIKDQLNTLKTSEDEKAAQKQFEMLIGQQIIPGLPVKITVKDTACQAYKQFWNRRAEKFLNLGQKYLENKSVDEGLILGAVAALKNQEPLHPKILDAYQSRQYALLKLTLRGHEGQVMDVSFSPDGKFIATASSDTTARIWEILSGKEQVRLSGHSRTVNSVSFSSDDRLVATGSQDGTIRIWDRKTGNFLGDLKGHTDSVFDVEFSPDGNLLVSGSNDRTARIWDTQTRQELHRFLHNERVRAVTFFTDGKRILTASDMVRIWDIESQSLLLKFEKNPTTAVTYSPDETKILRGWSDRMGEPIQIYDLTGKKLLGIKEQLNVIVSVAFFPPDGNRIMAASTDNKLRIWDAQPGTQPFRRGMIEMSYLPERGLNAAIPSPNGKWVAIAQADRTARVWDISSIIEDSPPEDLTKMTPQELWERMQYKLGLTVTDDDEVVPLWPTGPRKFNGWNPGLVEKYGKK